MLAVVAFSGAASWMLDAPGRGLPPPTKSEPRPSPVELIESAVLEPTTHGQPSLPTSASPTLHPATAGATAEPLPTPVLVPRPTLYGAAPLVHDPELASRVMERLGGRSGRFGIAIKDLATGRGVLVDPDGEYEAASLFKLWVMYEVFKQRELGNVSFGEALVLTERHVAYDLGTLDRPAGSTIVLGEALERMITISDNSSAILLTDRVGALNINRDLRALGLSHSRLVLDNLVTSPGDLLTFLEMLAQGSGVNEQASAEMLHLLARQRINDRIPRRLPAGTIVAHKTGNLPGVVNDAGIVYSPDASFIIAVLTNNTKDEAEAARATADLAALTYEYLRTVGPPEAGGLPTIERTPTPTPSPSPTETAIPTREEPTSAPMVEAPAPAATATPSTPVPGLTPATLRQPSAESVPSATPTAPPSATTLPSPSPGSSPPR